ncbi:MAG TPA: exosortase/archaeosortase family protein [Mycobacteriales bacterium]|nr:exosortase/archaeosortase family protein [Mycobacteriales bacterium]
MAVAQGTGAPDGVAGSTGWLAGPLGGVAAAARALGGFVASSPWGRLAALVCAVGLAYHYSLMTLLRTLGLDTPLAYLGLIPMIALAVAALRSHPDEGEPQIHDRQVDFIIGLPLLFAAVGIVLFMPDRMSTLFWYYRVDLLSLPLFTAGAIALFFGVRTLWRCRLAVLLLAFAWPLPYTWALNRGLDRFTGLTLGVLHALVQHVPVAQALAGGDGSEFLVGHGRSAFEVSVASACAGVDSFLGFFLIGATCLGFLQGGRLRKLGWLVSGLVLVYALNIGRIMLIFWAGSALGEHFAMDGLHPFIGLALFCLGVLLMVLLLPRYGLRLRPISIKRHPRRQSAPPWLATSGLRTAGAILAVTAVVLGVANAGLSRYTLVASDLGAPRLTAFETDPAQVPGWTVDAVGTFTWTARFFGTGSSWIRYQYLPRTSDEPTSVIADVVTTADLGSFNAYGIQACYNFHGFGVSAPDSRTLGGGVEGTLLTFRDPNLPEDWMSLSWVWPVRTPHGTRYERIVLLAPVQGAYLAGNGSATVRSTGSSPTTGVSSATRAAARDFLVHFARAVVQARAAGSATGAAGSSGGTVTSALGVR